LSAISIKTYSREAQRLLRFLTVGASGTILYFSLLSGLKLLGMATLPANTLSFLVGMMNNFYWNRRWTFADARAVVWKRQFFVFVAISLVGLLLNNSLVLLLEPRFNGWSGQWGYLPAKLIATGVVVGWNYLANRSWTFHHPVK
jgi:putative flippase GtrA